MNKEEIIEIIAAEHGIPKTKANEIIRTFLGTVQDAVVRGDKVTLVGFGIFEAHLAKPRTGHNPRTGEKVEIDAAYVRERVSSLAKNADLSKFVL